MLPCGPNWDVFALIGEPEQAAMTPIRPDGDQ